ncbi:ornithine decarboxylase 1-like [Condylostylus longicornis]|uniref:ornithine decarboxylase 1-like n=1 Tax=Condylostylus longicornis TaxID=2530218 RepID=UPI00244DB71F|nr:ornithine decarboxylase 1-like [Condylostylus longicornis]
MEGIIFYNDKLDLNDIVNSEEYKNSDESLMICDITEMSKKYNQWVQFMPSVKPFYAVKCNDNIMVLKVLNSLGVNFDCASKNEIEKVLSIDVAPDRIIFAHPTKLLGHINYAKLNGVKIMTFDTDFELFKIKEHYPDANLLLRIRCEAKLALGPLGAKFGCEPILIAPKLLELGKKLNLNIKGISFHVGSNCLDHEAYNEAIYRARQLFDIGKELGLTNMDLLDIGGGFPGSNDSGFKQISDVVNMALNKYFSDINVHFIAEPGRFFVTTAFQLLCKIHSKREIRINNNIEKIMYYINDGFYCSLNVVKYDKYKPIPKIIKYQSNTKCAIDETNLDKEMKETTATTFVKLYKSCIWGPTLDSLDLVYDDIYLPYLSINDSLIFDNMGAYSLVSVSGFNGFMPPKFKYYLNRQYNVKYVTEIEGM